MSAARAIRLGAVGYLNARPHVYGLDRSPRFSLRFDVPSRCADLLHAGDVDLGLIPSIEYVRAPAAADYRIVPDVAIASRGPVASVAIFSTRPIAEVRTLALDTSSRTSVALARVLCARVFAIDPTFAPAAPDLPEMLARSDAALIIGDNALFADQREIDAQVGRPVEKIDLGEVWTRATGLPFVYAFWAGRADALRVGDVAALQQARDHGVAHIDAVAAAYVGPSAERQAVGARYLRDNIKYRLGPEEQAGLELFFKYAAEAGIVEPAPLRFFGVE